VFLTSTLQKIQALMGGAATTTNPAVVVDWVDIVVASGGTPGASINALNGATAVDIIPAPAASTFRKVNGIWIFQEDTVAQIVTVRYNDNGTNRILVRTSLNPGDTLQFSDAEGWKVIDSAGQIKSIQAAAPGAWIKTTFLVSGTAHVVSAATRSIFLRMVAAGGGGGGVAANAAGNGTCAGGGAAGGYAEKRFTVIPGTSYTYAIGTAGTAGASGGGTGGTGGDTTFTVGGTTVTAKGGLGGTFIGTAATHRYALGGLGVTGTNGDNQFRGQQGRHGLIIVAGVTGIGGAGGSSMMGQGGDERLTTGAGQAASTGAGGGGGGALSLAAGAAQAGGVATQGAIIVDEFS